MKQFFLALLLLCVSSPLFATVVGKDYAQPTWEDAGNDWRPINVTCSTNTILISSTPAFAYYSAQQLGSNISTSTPLGITEWRKRVIVNMSTNAALSLYQDGSTYTNYTSSFGVVLSSQTTGLGFGDSWEVPHQGQVWGACSAVGGQVGGYETWWNEKKKVLIP